MFTQDNIEIKNYEDFYPDGKKFAIKMGWCKVWETDSKGAIVGGERQIRQISEGTGLPSYATNIDPPEVKEGYIPLFLDGKWIIKENHVGETVYSKKDGISFEIKEYGNIPNEYTIEKRPDQYHTFDEKTNKWIMTKESKKEKEQKEKTEIINKIKYRMNEIKSEVILAIDDDEIKTLKTEYNELKEKLKTLE